MKFIKWWRSSLQVCVQFLGDEAAMEWMAAECTCLFNDIYIYMSLSHILYIYTIYTHIYVYYIYIYNNNAPPNSTGCTRLVGLFKSTTVIISRERVSWDDILGWVGTVFGCQRLKRVSRPCQRFLWETGLRFMPSLVAISLPNMFMPANIIDCSDWSGLLLEQKHCVWGTCALLAC